MGWKGTLRSIAAAQRRAEREAKRRQRELERRRKELEKMREIEQAAYEVQVFENYIDVLASIHKDCSESWDWDSIRSSPPPSKPENINKNENKARKEYEEFKPRLMDKIFGRVESKKRELKSAIYQGAQDDEDLFREAMNKYETDYADWEAIRDLAGKLLEKDQNAYLDAIRQTDPFSEINQIGSTIKFNVVNEEIVEAVLQVNGEEVIPKESKRQLKSGKLSTKKMSKTKFYELYQDYVCGAVLRVARELMALLPIEMVIISAVGEILNTKTGHLENLPILSVALPRKTIDKLNFELLDPSDSMDNFVHNMKFLKTKGFKPVERLETSRFSKDVE